MRMLPVRDAAACAFVGALPRAQAGTIAVLRQSGAVEYPFQRAQAPQAGAPKGVQGPGGGPAKAAPVNQAQLAAWAGGRLPTEYRKVGAAVVAGLWDDPASMGMRACAFQ